MARHEDMKDELAKQLEASRIPQEQIITEHDINPPRKVGTGRVDVVWKFDNESSAKGVAFEIKTRLPSQSKVHVRMDAVRQLHRNGLAGYYPVLVSERTVWADESGSVSSLKRLVRALGATYVKVEDDPIEFSIAHDMLLIDVDTPECLI